MRNTIIDTEPIHKMYIHVHIHIHTGLHRPRYHCG